VETDKKPEGKPSMPAPPPANEDPPF